MRKGGKRVEWTTADEAYLLENAGRVPMAELCKHLRRSRESVASKARHLRERGKQVDLRCFVPRTALCPSCGCMRATAVTVGICEVCRRREQLAAVHARIADLMPLLSRADRDIYETTEAETGSRRDPRPPAPRPAPGGESYYRRARREEEWAIAVERVEIANVKREVKAAQKRKERIEKKVKSMPSFANAQVKGGKGNRKKH